MVLKEIIEKLGLEVRGKFDNLGRQINKGYASDLLSDVLANTEKGDLWITLQIHKNIVAVAGMKELSGIILINSREPEKETIEKAEIENMPILVSKLPAFELIGRLYALGVTGIKDNVKGV